MPAKKPAEIKREIHCPVCDRISARKFTILELAVAAVDLQKMLEEKIRTVFGPPTKPEVLDAIKK